MATDYDLLLRGGRVIDPRNKLDGIADVAIAGKKIAAVGKNLPGQAAKNIDVSGLLVTPGLIDIHLHAYGGYEGWLFPDQHNLPYGVTTAVDTGGAGWKDFEHFKTAIIEKSRTRVLAFLNIVRDGMIGPPEQDTTQMQPEPCAEMIRRYPQHLVGSKSAHFGGPGWESAGGAIEAARLSGTIAMIDFAPKPTRTYKELLERLSPGPVTFDPVRLRRLNRVMLSRLDQAALVARARPFLRARGIDLGDPRAAARSGLGRRAVLHTLRLALTGRSRGPELPRLLALLGREAALRRLERALEAARAGSEPLP